jgi:hypothetical protein
MLCHVALVRTYVSEERIVSIIKLTRIGELGKTIAVTSSRSTLRLRLLVTAIVASSPILLSLMMKAILSSETSFLTRAIRRNLPEDGILHNHRRENLKLHLTRK